MKLDARELALCDVDNANGARQSESLQIKIMLWNIAMSVTEMNK